MFHVKPDYRYVANVLRVIDADTLLCAVDLGFRLNITTPVRLLGINAPELKTQAGKDAMVWVSQWLEANGREVTVISAKPGDFGDKYGRWLGTLYSGEGDNEKCLNRDMLTAGQAVAMAPGGRKA